MKNMSKLAGFLVLLLGCFAVYWQNFKDVGTKDEETIFQTVSVVRVVDGDTLVVEMDGEDRKVRLIGIDCEESVHADAGRNTEKGRQQSEFTKALLPKGATVYLAKDTSDTDQYDRLLRYVWLEIPDNAADIEEVRTKMLNGILIDQADTQVKDYPPDVMYSDIFKKIEENSDPY